MDVIPNRLGVTAQRYPVHVVITFFSICVIGKIVLDKLKEEVKDFFALIGRF